jgi:hypothetical protein
MSEPIYTADGIVETRWEPAASTMEVTWWKLSGHEHLRPCVDAQAALVRTRDVQAVIVDVAHAEGVLSDADQAYLAEVLFPEYGRRGTKGVVTVLPASALTRISAAQWSDSGEDQGLRMMSVGSWAEARAAIRELLAAAA